MDAPSHISYLGPEQAPTHYLVFSPQVLGIEQALRTFSGQHGVESLALLVGREEGRRTTIDRAYIPDPYLFILPKSRRDDALDLGAWEDRFMLAVMKRNADGLADALPHVSARLQTVFQGQTYQPTIGELLREPWRMVLSKAFCFVPPMELEQEARKVEANGKMLLGIVHTHTHPQTPAQPSVTDVLWCRTLLERNSARHTILGVLAPEQESRYVGVSLRHICALEAGVEAEASEAHLMEWLCQQPDLFFTPSEDREESV